ncbi:MAG: PAS domain S-box protein [Methanoregula sp.]
MTKKLLIANDNAKDRDFLEILLRSGGYTVVTAAGGAEALEKLKWERFDGIVSDILMPGMDGFVFLRQCRKDPTFRSIPFIFYTANYTDTIDKEFGLSLGAGCYLSKPAEPQELLRQIAECLDNGPVPVTEKEPDEDTFLRGYAKRVGLKLEKKQIALTESEEKYRVLAEASDDIIFIADPGGTYLYINPFGAERLGRTPEMVVGMSTDELFPEDIAAEQKRLLSLVVSSGKAVHTESLVPVLDGKHWYDIHLLPIRSINGEIREIMGTVRDITCYKTAEEVLRRSEERYRTLFEQSPLSLWEENYTDIHQWIEAKRASGVTDFARYFAEHPEDLATCASMVRVEKINAATMALVGAGSEAAFYDGIGKVLTEKSYLTFRDEIVAFAAGKTQFEGESVIRTLDGRIRNILVLYAVVRGYEETLAKVFTSIIDITERRQAENALVEANRKLNLLNAITRHDILNQLLVLKGYLEISKSSKGDPERLADCIAKEENAANAIEAQIRFTRTYQDIGITAPVWQNVQAGFLRASAGLPIHNVKVDIDRADIEVLADPLFGKVFYNLIDNALRYGGERMTTISVRSRWSGHDLTISCEDDGVGIAQEYRPRLFERGFGKHTGLGLYLSREILAITRMTITENGEPGCGARFEISVPEGGWRIAGTIAGTLR